MAPGSFGAAGGFCHNVEEKGLISRGAITKVSSIRG